VTLETGTYDVEWFGVDGRTTEASDQVVVEARSTLSFTPPFGERAAVLVLTRASG
jgi:hypothetical protein